MGTYSDLLREPGAKRLILSVIPGRTAYGMLGLAIFFFVHDRTGSIATAGLATGIETLLGSLGAGTRGYFIDRYGQTRPLTIFVPMWVTLVWILSIQHSTIGILIMCGVVGIFSPPINLSARPLWRQIAGPERLRVAYSIDTTIGNVSTLFGPVIATTLALKVSPSAALWAVALSMFIGGMSMITMPISRAWVPEPEPKNPFSLIKTPAILILIIEGAIFGLAWGILDISIPAASTLNKTPALTAPLMATTAAMSIIAGLVIGAIKHNVTPLAGFKFTNTLLALCSLPLVFTTPGWSMGVVLAMLGFMLGAASIYHMEVLEAVRPMGSATSAQAWQWTIEGSMIAVGAALGGYVNQHFGVSTALAIVTCGFIFSTLFVWIVAAPRLSKANQPLSDLQVGQALADTESPAK